MNFLNTVWQDIKQESKANKSFVFIILTLLSIPFYSIGINNFSLILLVISSFLYFKKANFKINTTLLLPIILYLLMLISCFWTIDIERTIPALSKEISLLIIPLCFMIFGSLNSNQTTKIISYYSYGTIAFCVFYLINAVFRYINTLNTDVFFYHELVTKDVNAIHVSVYMSVAFFYFFTKNIKKTFDYIAISLLLLIIFLLSSKNIILVFIVLIILYQLYYSKTSNKMRLRNLLVFAMFLGLIFSFGKIKNRFKEEFQINTHTSLNANVIEKMPTEIHNISIKEAWCNTTFTPNDYFPGTAFRVYQFRIFLEMIHENSVFWTGFGLNASYKKIEEKGNQYNVYKGIGEQDGYQKKNFHNQYVQNFADLGFVGFLILIIILSINLRNAIKSKDFIFICFAVLMISLFLTESFLWRQRGVVFFTVLFCVFNSKNQK